MLIRAVAATVAVQVAIVMASLTAPVLASLIAPEASIPPYLIGYYSALIYGCGAATSLVTPGLVRRYGAIRLHQGMLALVAAALVALCAAHWVFLVLSAIMLGLAYGPMNPASTVLIARYTPPILRARIFSLKQTAVPIGGALAGFVTPLLAAHAGWRAASLCIAAACAGLMLALQWWRDGLDEQRDPLARLVSPSFWLPARIMLRPGGMRTIAAASFAFGAIQFSFSAVFTTVLTQSGWRLRDAGAVLSLALVASIVSRIAWGWAADRMSARLILGILGTMMTGGAVAAAFIGPGWPGIAVAGIAVLFGLSAFCWAGIGVAETVRQVPASEIAEASAGAICLTFLGALAGPALFSSATALAGGFRASFLLLAALCAIPSALLLIRPADADLAKQG